MVNSDSRVPSLGEAAALYLAKLPQKDRDASQPEVYKFARWYGWESSFSGLAAPAVASYAEQLSVSDTDYARKLVLVRAFLAYGKKVGWSKTNLGTHLKTKKAKAGPRVAPGRVQRESASLSRQKYDELTVELDNLKQRSRDLIGEIQRAAADKDFRENAPLAAAREERGHVEGRIKELEQMLNAATIIDEKKEPAKKSVVGDNVVLSDLASGEEFRYMIVDPREVDPLKGKISIASPLGKALLGRKDGDMVEIKAPAGILRYQIKRIER
jgi:transcription elongation factor GreA